MTKSEPVMSRLKGGIRRGRRVVAATVAMLLTGGAVLAPGVAHASTSVPTLAPTIYLAQPLVMPSNEKDNACYDKISKVQVSRVGMMSFDIGPARTLATDILFRISNASGNYLKHVATEKTLHAATCVAADAATSGDSTGWISIPNLQYRPLFVLFDPSQIPSKSVLEVAYRTTGGVSPEVVIPLKPTQNFDSAPSTFTCAMLTVVSAAQVISHVALNLIASVFPEMPWVQDINNVTNVVVSAESSGLSAAIPQSKAEIAADYKTAKDAIAGIKALQKSGIKAALEKGSSTVVKFIPAPVNALDLVSELAADKADSQHFYDAIKGVGCSF